MTSGSGPPRRPLIARAVAGAAFVLGGLALLSAMLAISYGHTPMLERALFGLGIGPISFVAALGQCAILIGLWLLWTVAHRES